MNETPAREPPRRNGRNSVRFTPKLLRDFLTEKKKEGLSQKSIVTYRWNLTGFYNFLGEDKLITQDSLSRWQENLIREGYAPGTINGRISTVNSFYDYLGQRNWQVVNGQRALPRGVPELSREEYLALLKEAKNQENIQLYLLVKLLCCTDLTPGDIPLLTREAVNEGIVIGKERGTKGILTLPKPLRRELLEYARQRGIQTGPLFLNGNRRCHSRTTIMKMIQKLSQQIGLESGKANPRNLRRLHLSTQSAFQKQADAWAAEQYANLLNQEEDIIGWRIFQAGGYHE